MVHFASGDNRPFLSGLERKCDNPLKVRDDLLGCRGDTQNRSHQRRSAIRGILTLPAPQSFLPRVAADGTFKALNERAATNHYGFMDLPSHRCVEGLESGLGGFSLCGMWIFRPHLCLTPLVLFLLLLASD